MKVGILTLPLHTNYGGILQAFALYRTLLNLGCPVKIIDNKLYSINSVREYVSVFIWQICKILGFRKTDHPQLCLRKNMEFLLPFINNYIPNQQPLNNLKATEFDAIIVGSDQVWRGEYSPLLPYFLDFAKDWDIIRIAYAASFGMDEWTVGRDVLEKCVKLANQFNYISVREKSGIRICRERLNCSADLVLDPTLLLTQNDYLSILNSQPSSNKSLVTTYILDEDIKKSRIIKTVSEEYKTDILNLVMPHDGNPSYPVETWLGAILGSKIMITDSFHGMVFSILFNRPFIILGNMQRGISRFSSLLELLGLENRIVKDELEVQSLLKQDIDWYSVNEKIDHLRTESIEKLKRALGL